MNKNLKYRGSVRAISDRLVADIYQIIGAKEFLVFFFNISLTGKKQFLRKKVIIAPRDFDYATLKHQIRENLILDAYNEIPNFN